MIIVLFVNPLNICLNKFFRRIYGVLILALLGAYLFASNSIFGINIKENFEEGLCATFSYKHYLNCFVILPYILYVIESILT